MTPVLQLDPPRRIGDRRVAVLCERLVEARALGGAVLARGHKIPLAVLIARSGTITAFDLTGRPLDPETLDAACPGLLGALLANARAVRP